MMQVFVSKLIALKNDERIFRILGLCIPVLMGIFIFIIPFPYKTATQEICFYLSVFMVLTLTFYKKIKFTFKSPLTLPLILFTLWTFISLPFALNKENTLHDIYGHLLKYIAIFYLVANSFNDRKRFVILTWILILSASIFSIGGIVYFYVIPGQDLSMRIGLPAVGIGVNYIGFFTITAIFLSLNYFSREVNLPFKTLSIICVPVLLATTILTWTRGTYLGLILPLVLLFPRHKKTVSTFILAVIIVIALTPAKLIFTPNAIINKYKGEERKAIWYTYWKAVKDHPITGIGYGMQTYHKDLLAKYNLKTTPEFRMQSFHAPHNTFIDVAVRLGVVGLALFLYIIFVYSRMGWQLIRYGRDDFIKSWALCLTAAFLSFLIQGMVADMLLGVQIIIFFVLMAMMTVLWRLNEDRHVAEETRDD